MYIPSDQSRGCIAQFKSQQLTRRECQESLLLKHIVDMSNGVQVCYRDATDNKDITTHVFRWCFLPFHIAFEEGFQARPKNPPEQEDTVYYNIHDHVNHGGRPLFRNLDPNVRRHGFVSTTKSSKWRPVPQFENTHVVEAFRYEIYAPGAIIVEDTLKGDYDHYKSQEEITFVQGIAPQYIRAAQKWRFISASGNYHFATNQRVDNIIYINTKFKDFKRRTGLKFVGEIKQGKDQNGKWFDLERVEI